VETDDSRWYQSGSNGNNMVTVGSSSSLFYFILYLYKYIMVLTRDEKETLVLDLYNHRTPIRDIAREAGMSFRDIGRIIDKKEKEKEARERQVQQITQSTQAYKLFSEGKSPIQVAVALNIREPEATQYYREYWKLRQLHSLNWVYEQVKDNIGYFVSLYIAAKVARMDVQHVIRLLEIANNHLPSVEYTYENRKREVDDLEAEKRNSARIYQELSDQIATMRKTLDQYQLSCKEERLELTKLQMQKVRIQGLVDNFQNDNEEYIKIRNTVEEKVHSVLSDKKTLLKLALLSLTESLRKDPDRYSSLIYHNSTSSNTDYNSQNYETASYGQRQQYQSQDYISMLIEEAEKLYTSLIKEWVDEIISDYASSISSSLLPLLPSTVERQSHPTTTTTTATATATATTTAANQTHMRTEEHRLFTQSEINDDD
jgi:hypothetical protein